MDHASSVEASWLRRFHSADTPTVRLVCLPHAGGSASFFFPVAQALAPAVDVVAVQYPGRQDRRSEPCLDTIDGLADGVAEALEAGRGADGVPLALFGHSMGAVVAYEVARRLQARGVMPVRLFASGRRAPSARRHEVVHLANDDDFVTAVGRLGGLDAAFMGDDELRAMVLPALRSDYRAIETYRHAPGQELACPVTVLLGEGDPLATLEEARGWARHTSAGCELHTYAGGHFYLVDQQAEVVALVAERLGVPVPPPTRSA